MRKLKQLLPLIAIVLASIFTSCYLNQPINPTIESGPLAIDILQSPMDVDAEGGSYTIGVIPNIELDAELLEIESTEAWLICEEINTEYFIITIEPNSDNAERYADCIISYDGESCQRFTIRQLAKE